MFKNQLLENMRAKLVSIQEMMDALANKDMELVSEIAEIQGGPDADLLSTIDRGMFPTGFAQVFAMMRRDYQQIAKDAVSFDDLEYSVEQISNLLGRCVSCHQAYRVEVR